jgi:hypothetical protein
MNNGWERDVLSQVSEARPGAPGVAAGGIVEVAEQLIAKSRGLAPLSARQDVSTFAIHGYIFSRERKSPDCLQKFGVFNGLEGKAAAKS